MFYLYGCEKCYNHNEVAKIIYYLSLNHDFIVSIFSHPCHLLFPSSDLVENNKLLVTQFYNWYDTN